MARGDGIHRTNARNMRLTETKIGNTQQHNEREKDSYVNQDIVLERTPLNVHFKTPSAGYREMFAQMEADGVTGVYSSMWSVRYLSRKLNEEMSLPQASWTVT